MLKYIIITEIIKKIKNKFGNNKNNRDLFINNFHKQYF